MRSIPKTLSLSLFLSKLTIIACSMGINFKSFPVIAAEKIILQYGQLEFTLAVKSLETYTKTGKIERDLANYTKDLTEEQLKKLQTVLQTKSDLDSVTLANFLKTPQGEIILKKLGEVIKTNTRRNGFYGIRSALILAAIDEEGLTPLNILKKFPTSEIRISSQEGLEIFNLVTNTINDTNKAIASIESQAQSEIQQEETLLYALNTDLREKGNVNFFKQSLNLKDKKRDRLVPVDLYQPETKKAPLVVISHGLGSDRTTFAYLAKHLASWGFAVAVVEHPGSNSEQVKALLNGLGNKAIPPQEMIDRPLDIKFVLDELEDLYNQEINTKQVGVIGQSFGAYTSLALAGAKLNWDKLKKNCQIDNNKNFNGSLLLQCIVLKLPEQEYDLKDERIVGAIAINPLTSSIFGEDNLSKIKIPVMIMSGSNDTVTPALPEQIIPFTWLTNPDKYLVLMEGGTHFSTLHESSGSIPVPADVIGPNPQIGQEYVKALSLAFFQTYIVKNSSYQEYLKANYAEFLSQPSIPLNLVTSLKKDVSN